MPETYDISISVKILKASNKEALADEDFFFNSQPVAKMANIADEFFELVAKLQKVK